MKIKLSIKDKKLRQNKEVIKWLKQCEKLINKEILQRTQNLMFYGTTHPEIDFFNNHGHSLKNLIYSCPNSRT